MDGFGSRTDIASSKVAMEGICIQQAHELMAGPGRDIIKLK